MNIAVSVPLSVMFHASQMADAFCKPDCAAARAVLDASIGWPEHRRQNSDGLGVIHGSLGGHARMTSSRMRL